MKRSLVYLGTHLIPICGHWVASVNKRAGCKGAFVAQTLRAGSTTSSSTESDALSRFEESEQLPDSEELEMMDDNSLIFDEKDECTSKRRKRATKSRSASDFLIDLVTRSGVENDIKSMELRQLISERSVEYIEELQSVNEKVGSPNDRLLQFLAPKIPAIKHLPEISLRVQSRKTEMDPGVAAALVGVLGRAQELYENHDHDVSGAAERPAKAKKRRKLFAKHEKSILEERRFEQLIECLLCGVDIERQTEDDEGSPVEACDESSLSHEPSSGPHNSVPGISIRDACRAAWGLAVLGIHRHDSLAGESVRDILVALSKGVRTLLLTKLENLRRNDLSAELTEDSATPVSLEEWISVKSEELAEDVATAMWTFGCVRVCTGWRSVPLFEVCASILCQDPVDIRRQAQEDPVHNAADVGVNDVIARLESAETAGTIEEAHSQDESRQILLDWLSPKEMVDVLWSMALHDTKEKDELALSENVGTLAELGFDRVMHLLREEIEFLKHIDEYGEEPPNSDTAKPVESNLPTETMIVQVSGNGQDNEEVEVEVIDASSLLPSSPGGDEVSLDSTSTENGNVDETEESSSLDADDIAVNEADNTKSPSSLSIFTPHDLCSIVWVATELRDSLRPHVTAAVTEMFAILGEDEVVQLSPGDLSNLAWALAKSDISDIQAVTCLGEWIAKSALHCINNDQTGEELSNLLLEHFRPPELSRLLWSITIFLDSSLLVSQGAPKELSVLALRVAAANREMFGTEDLARILWAFLDLHRFEVDGPSPRDLRDVGALLATIETSLLFWEKMVTNSVKSIDQEDSVVRESVRFASFFGRTRFHFPLLDQSKDNDGSPDDDDEFAIPSKSKLPLLRDIPVDPSTLCKLTSSLHFYSKDVHNLDDGGSFLTRVVVRLLASRNGRLLRECPIQDLVKLCSTLAVSKKTTSRETLGLFVRRLLRLINEDTLLLKSASIEERAMMVFSLGELGARFDKPDEDVSTSYRRLHWTDASHFFSVEELRTMSDEALTMSITGMVNLNVAEHDATFLAECLVVARERVETCSNVFGMAESVALAKSQLPDGNLPDTLPTATKDSLEREGENQKDEQEIGDESPGKTLNVTDNSDSALAVADSTSFQCGGDMREQCDEILQLFSNRLQFLVTTMTLTEIRRLLEVYTMAAVRSDALVETIAEEISVRRSNVTELSPANLAEIIHYGAASADRARVALFGESSYDGSNKSHRRRLLSFFGSKTRDDKDGDNGEPKSEEYDEEEVKNIQELSDTEELQLHLETALQSIRSLSSCVHTLRDAGHSDVSEFCKSSCQNALLEIGRCEELLRLYYRIDFEAGTRLSRFDHERRRDIAKDMLTRLLPTA